MNKNCVTGKRSFVDEELALEALVQNHIINDYPINQGPCDVYKCIECDNWHFTSKGRNALLDDPEIIARIKKDRLANQWERRLR
ncbi:hypothetical protein [Ekhidna sp.]|uniref:hypothetical protein n=1 Tax=Ekhidna sp. TaxID=2608089 RepID=UPI00329A0773